MLFVALTVVAFPARLIQAQICQHSFHYFLDDDPDFNFETTPPNDSTMAAAIQSKMGVPITVVTSPLFMENPAFPPVLGNTGMAPGFNYGPTMGPVGTGGEIENINLRQPIVLGIVRGQLRTLFNESLCDPTTQYPRFLLRVFTSAGMFHDVLIRSNFCSYQPDANGVCGSTSVGWDFYEISGPRPIPGPVVLNSAASRKAHGGTLTFDVTLPSSGRRGVECRTGGANGIYQMVFKFNTPLSSVGSANVTSGTGGVMNSMIGTDPREYIVNLSGVANAQYIIVTLTNVNDTAGNHDDSVSATMGVLTGDTNNDGFCDAVDTSQVKSQSGNPVGPTNFREDLNTDDFIDAVDTALAKSKSGTSLPTPP